MSASLADSDETQALIERARSGHRDAADELFARHLEQVRSAVRRRIRRGVQARFDSSDIVQETYSLAQQNLDNYLAQRPMPFALWLLKLAHNRLVDYERLHLFAMRRSVAREVPLPDESSLVLLEHVRPSPLPSPTDVAVSREQGRIIRRCLAQLPEMDREVLLLRAFEGLSNSEVATVLEIAPEAAKKRFTRALLRLRKLLREAGID